MWILINWSNADGSDILPVNDAEGSADTKQFATEEKALKWASKNLNFEYQAIEL
jgi:hypothetical protein